MPSSRATRRNYKLGSGRPWSVDGPPPERGKEYVSEERREQYRQQRAALAEKFAKLPIAERRALEGKFRKALRAICTSNTEFEGFWTLRMAPLLAQKGKPPASSASIRLPAPKAAATPLPPRMPRADKTAAQTSRAQPAAAVAKVRSSPKPSPAQHAEIDRTIVEFVGRHPDVMTQKVCVKTLCGAADARVKAAGFDRTPAFGRLRALSLEAVHSRVASLVSRGFLERGAGGALKRI